MFFFGRFVLLGPVFKGKKTVQLLVAGILISTSALARADFTFLAGDYYTSNYFSRVITQYNPNGDVVGSYTVPSALADEVRGITFGPDGLLYADLSSSTGSFKVVALDSSGTIHATYTGSTYVGGNLSYGKILIDGQYLYVSGQGSLTRFVLGDPSSGTVIYTSQTGAIFDQTSFANGDLLVATDYAVNEVTANGVLVRTIPPVGDVFNNLRGIAYDAASNIMFVTEIGRIFRVDATTGLVLGHTDFDYADDAFLDSNGNLLVGSRTQTPHFYSQDLKSIGMLGGGQQMFVTQLVPEPTTVPCLVAGLAVLMLYRARRRIF